MSLRSPELHRLKCVTPLIALLLSVLSYSSGHAETYLTGQIEDGESQKIEMPRLPGTFVRSIAWMAPEGEPVKAGDLVLTLDPGDLSSQEETLDIEKEGIRKQADADLAQNAVAIIDAKMAVAQAESALKMAAIDAAIPIEAITGLIFEQYQLNFVNAKNELTRAGLELENLQKAREELVPVQALMVEQADANYQRIVDALEETNIYAEKAGLMIYGENPMTGEKVYPGESLPPSSVLAMVANQSSLIFRFWVHEANINKLEGGMRLIVTPDAIPDAAIEAEISWMSKQAATRDNWSEGGYFEVIADPLEIVPDDFVAGMSVMAKIKQ